MNLLEEIVGHKLREVAQRRELYPTKLLERSIYFASPPVSLTSYLLRPDKAGLIAEIKRKSPSRGVLNKYISVEELSVGYMQAGASALSVLTDKEYFGGSSEDLTTARKFNFCPILRKDFVVDEYQVIEARSIGADAVLLIARILTAAQVRSFAVLARRLGMEVLFEVHDRTDLEKLCEEIALIGVNNRDLDDLSVDYRRALALLPALPEQSVKVAESGISSARVMLELKAAGFAGFLVGEAFMKTSAPAEACAALLRELRKEQHAAAA